MGHLCPRPFIVGGSSFGCSLPPSPQPSIQVLLTCAPTSIVLLLSAGDGHHPLLAYLDAGIWFVLDDKEVVDGQLRCFVMETALELNAFLTVMFSRCGSDYCTREVDYCRCDVDYCGCEMDYCACEADCCGCDMDYCGREMDYSGCEVDYRGCELDSCGL